MSRWFYLDTYRRFGDGVACQVTFASRMTLPDAREKVADLRPKSNWTLGKGSMHAISESMSQMSLTMSGFGGCQRATYHFISHPRGCVTGEQQERPQSKHEISLTEQKTNMWKQWKIGCGYGRLRAVIVTETFHVNVRRQTDGVRAWYDSHMVLPYS